MSILSFYLLCVALIFFGCAIAVYYWCKQTATPKIKLYERRPIETDAEFKVEQHLANVNKLIKDYNEGKLQ
jgi:phage gp36-like protein